VAHGLGLLLDGDPLLGLDRLVQTIAPLPAHHESAGELVHDDDAHPATLVWVRVRHHDILLVALVQVVGLERLVDEVGPLHVAGGVKALDAGQLLGRVDAILRSGGRNAPSP